MPKEFVLPDLGEGIHEAQVVRLLIKEGDRVEEDQSLMEVETDKAAVEIPSPFAGVASKVHVAEGQTINVGSVIVTFDDGAGTKPAAKAPAAKEEAREPAPKRDEKPAAKREAAPAAREEAPPREATREAEAAPARTTAAAAPAVRKLARELGIDIDEVPGSGPGGRVTKEDVERYAKAGAAPRAEAPAAKAPAAPAPAVPTAAGRAIGPAAEIPKGTRENDKWGSVVRVPLSQIRKTIAQQMARSAYTIPHVTHCDEIDITELERVRAEINDATGGNPKMTVMTFVIRALCIALKRHPIFNASFDEEGGQTIYKEYYNVGIAVDTPRGLIVPVIRNADQLSLGGIAEALRAIAEKVRTNQFAIEDLRGGTFTITNVGALGGTVSTPIINYPEVAILGLGKARKLPVYKGDQIVPAMLMPMNLSFDHRATDGANAARFAGDIITLLQKPQMLLLY